MSTEYGVFDDEGCLDRGYYSEEKALEAALEIRKQYADEGEASRSSIHIAAMCPDHDEQEAEWCEECWAENDEEEGDE